MSRPPVPYWTIPALASDCEGGWNLHRDCIVAYLAAGQLSAELREHDGAEQLVVTCAEKARFEGSTESPMSKRREHSLLRIIGGFAVAYSGGDVGYLAHPYTLHKDAEATAARHGAQWPCSAETAADAIRDGIELLRQSGHYRPPKSKTAEPAVVQPQPELKAIAL